MPPLSSVTISMLGDSTRLIALPRASIIVFDEPIAKVWCVVMFNADHLAPRPKTEYITAPTQDQAIHQAFNMAERG